MNRLLVSLLYRHIQIYTFIDRHVRKIFMHEQSALFSIDIIRYIHLQIDRAGQYSCKNRLLSFLQTYSDIYIYRQTWQDNIYSTYIHNQIQIDISPRYSNEPDSDVCIIPRSQTSQCASHRGMSQVIKSYEKFFFLLCGAHCGVSSKHSSWATYKQAKTIF